MTQHKKKLLLGAHLSIAGGIHKALEKGTEIGCTTIQIFTKSNRQWKEKEISPNEINLYNQSKKTHAIDPVISHASYLINLGSMSATVVQQSIKALINELDNCELLSIPYLIIHPGSSSNQKEATKQIAHYIDEILSSHTGSTQIILETMAGQGNSVIYNFEQLAELLSHIHHKKRIGVCIDTCHIFAAGYDLVAKDAYEATIDEFDNLIGLNLLKVIHMNDSKKECGSRVDRHENIGKGKIGLEGFTHIMNDRRLLTIPKILETPKATLHEDLINMRILTNLIENDLKNELIISVK